MKKRVLVSLLEDDKALAQKIAADLGKVGLVACVHLWNPDLESLAWSLAATELDTCALWVVAGNGWDSPEARKSLSLAALHAQAQKSCVFPILLRPTGTPPDVAALPLPLQGAEIATDKLGTKAAVKAAVQKKQPAPYRLRPLAIQGLGLWFELGPAKGGQWEGAFFACGAKDSKKAFPLAHGVGPAGTIPERCVLNYAIQGAKLSLKDIDCEGWGTQNILTDGDSYYLRLGETPDVLAFGPFPKEDDTELYTVTLA